MVELITGTAGKDHVSSADFGSYNAGIIGEGTYILPRGKRLLCEKISDNLVKINDGDMVFKGRHIRIEPEDYEEVTVENGASGTKRHDLICIRVEKNEDTQIETASFVVVKGEFADNPVDPEYTQGTILENDYLVDESPICRVVLNGLQIESVAMLISEISSISELLGHIRNLDDRKADGARTSEAINELANNVTELDNKKANATETNEAISELANSVSNLNTSKAEQTAVEALSTSVNDLGKSKAEQTELEALKERMDTFEALPDGSTAGNEELLDIRNGADGVTYDSAGKAVRAQFDNVNERIDSLTETATTTDTTLTGSKASALKINGIRGKSEQKSYTGKQLLNHKAVTTTASGITSTVNDDKSIRMTGTPTITSGTVIFYATSDNNLVADTEYVFSVGAKTLSDWHMFLSATEQLYSGAYKSKGSILAGGTTLEFSITEEEKEAYPYVIVQMGVYYSYTNVDRTFYPMIYDASVTDTTYEPYVGGIASPNPKYKQDIKSVGDKGSLKVTAHGKNFFKFYTTDNSDITVSGLTIKRGNTLSYSGTTEKSVYRAIAKLTLKAGTYTISINKLPPTGMTYRIWRDVSYEDVCTYFASYFAERSRILTLTEDTTILFVLGTESIGTTFNETGVTCQIELGEKATPYEPCTEKSIIIPLPEPPRSVDTVEDEVVKQDGVWGVLRGIGSCVFDGNESWTAMSDNRYYTDKLKQVIKKPTSNEIASVGFCNYYSIDKKNNMTDKTFAIETTGNVFFRDSVNAISANTWKAWLAENQPSFTYIRSEPVFEPFPDEYQHLFYELESFDAVTYITTDSEVQPTIEVEYAISDAGVHLLNNYAKSNIAELKANKALPENSTTRNTAITEVGQYAVDAVELNPSVNGTLAWQVAKTSTDASSTDVTVNASFIGSSNYELHKVGKTAMFSATFSLGRASSISSPLFTMPEDYIPISNVYGLLSQVEVSDGIYNFALDTSGNIVSDVTIPEGTYYITVTYLCAE